MVEKDDVIARLRRIEGQVRGLARMVEEESACEQILTQLLAARSALDQAGMCIITRYIDHCMPEHGTAEDWQLARQRFYRILQLLTRMG